MNPKINNYDNLLKNAISSFTPVEEEHGWRVYLNGVWYCKNAMPGTPKRVYASRNAAKVRTEEEFNSWFIMTFNEDNKKLYDDCYEYETVNGIQGRRALVSRQGKEFLDRACTKQFREWMNQLYEAKIVEYREV